MKYLNYLPILLAFSLPSQATVMYGTIGNFDVVNDTGRDAHGFEIEYEGLKSTDIGYTWTYSRYGNAQLVETTSAAGVPTTVVRYTAKFDTAANKWSATTYAAGFPWLVTGAHQCTSPVATDGCEHFVNGMFARAVVPKSVSYHWLVDNGAGTLARAEILGFLAPPPAINIPVYQPPIIIQPAPINNVVQAPIVQIVPVMPAPKEPVEPAPAQWGTPHWVKVIKTTTHNAKPVDAALLINEDKNGDGAPDWANGEPAQVESEWYLVQKEPAGKNGGAKAAHVGAAEQIKQNEKVTRKYEFYKYGGGALSFDGETHEAMCDAVGTDNIHGSQASVGVTNANGDTYNYDCTQDALIGDYIGANMVGFEMAAPLTAIEVIDNGQVGKAYVARSVISGGNTPYTVTTSGQFPAGLAIDPVTGILTGMPIAPGLLSFDVNATDADRKAITKSYTISITDANGNLVIPAPAISTQMLDNGVEGADYFLQLSAVSGTAPFTWTVNPALPSGLALTQGGVVSGKPAVGTGDVAGKVTTHTFTVTDKNGKTDSKMFTLTIAAPAQLAVACSGVDEPNLAVTARLSNIAKFDGTLISSAYLTTANNSVAIPAAGVAYTFNGVAAGSFPVGALISYTGTYGLAQNALTGKPMWCIPTAITVKAAPVICVLPQVRDAGSNICVTPPVVCVAPKVRDAATNTCVTPATGACVVPAGAKKAPDIHAKLTAVNGKVLTIGTKKVTLLDCAKVVYKGTAKAPLVPYDADSNKGYILNGVTYSTAIIIDDGK